VHKCRLRPFLAANPFSNPLTAGLFYREKMRAIHRVAPDALRDGAGQAGDEVRAGAAARPRVLEVGGGRSGLGTLLYPGAHVTTLDLDPAVLGQGPGAERCGFVCGDACRLPFDGDTFDVVTLFDVLEHIPDDRGAACEAMRVTRPGGWVLVSTPDAAWRYPYHGFLRRWCPPESELMDAWGHVRRGYTPEAVSRLFGAAPARSATFVNPVTAFFHDVGFSRLGPTTKRALYALAAPATLMGYALHRPESPGTETAFAWRRD